MIDHFAKHFFKFSMRTEKALASLKPKTYLEISPLLSAADNSVICETFKLKKNVGWVLDVLFAFVAIPSLILLDIA
jgi:hypothetical protein